MPSDSFFADDPVNGSDAAPDKLGRDRYASYLVTLLDRISAQSDSSVLALIGPWGSGKSSVLGMILSTMKDRDDWRIAEFNPWVFSDLETMLLGFFSEISAALPDGEGPSQIRAKAGEFVKRISPLGSIGSLAGPDLQGIVEGLGSWIAGDRSSTKQKEQLAEALGSWGGKILVVVDDLDRLAPAELLLVFKLVRFVGRLPHVYYLLSYDERTLLDVLARTELCGDAQDRAQDYLEKIVQVRLDLPPLRQAQAVNLLSNGIENLRASLSAAGVEEGERFGRAYDACLHDRLVTPRAINRYLAQVGALYTSLGGEVDFYDFALLTYVRMFEPVLYAALHRMRNELAVAYAQPASYMDETDHMDRWRELMRLARVSDEYTEGLIAILAELFLPVAGARTDGAWNASAVRAVAGRKGVGHLDYFDRYFGFGIPDDDVSDVWVREILARLDSCDREDPEIRELGFRLITDTQRIIRKISAQRLRELPTSQAIIDLLAQYFGELSDSSSDGPSRRQAVQRFGETLVREHPAEKDALLCRLMVSPGGVLLSTRLLTSSLIEASQTTVAENTRHVKEICEKYFGYPFSDIPKDIKNLIWAWRMVDRGSCQHWLRGQVDSGQWNPLDIAGWCISSRLSDGKQILDAFQGETLDDLLGLDYLRQILHDQLKVLPELEGREFFDTVEDRRLAALYCLRSSSERADLQYQIHLDSDRKARLDRSVSHGAPLSPTEQARNSWIGSGLRFLTIFGR